MVFATSVLVVFSLALTFFAGPLYGYAERAADAIRDMAYVSTVLPKGLR